MAVEITGPGEPPAANTYSPDDSLYRGQRVAEGDAAISDILKGLDIADSGATNPGGVDVVHPEGVEIPTAPAAPADAPAPSAEAGASAEPPKTAAEVKPDPDTSRGEMRLLEREKAASDRELSLDKREREFEGKYKELEASLAKRVDPKDLAKRLDEDVLGFFQEVGVDPVQVSRLIIGATLGDKAPAEIRDAADKYKRQKEMADLRQSIADIKFEEQVARIKADTAKFVGDNTNLVGKYAALNAVATVDRRIVEDAILGEIGRDAAERGIKEPSDKLLTHDQAAAKVEARWEVFRRAFAASAPAQTPPAASTPAAPATTAPKGTEAPKTKQESRPVPPRRYWQGDRDDEVASALQEALAIATRKVV